MLTGKIATASSSVVMSTDFKLRLFRLRRWWAASSGLRKCSLTFVALFFLCGIATFSLLMTCFNTKHYRHSRESSTDSVVNNNAAVISSDASSKHPQHRRQLLDLAKGSFHTNYLQKGRVITKRGTDFVNVTAQMTTSMAFSFSPEVETYFSEAVYDPFDENTYVGLGPAILENEDGTMLTIQRVWFAHYDVLYSKDPDIKTKNTWQENFLYKRNFDSNWMPLERGNILGIPTSTNCHYAYRSDGPMDPRLFTWNGTTFLSFHIWQFDRDQSDIRGRMFMWNYDKNQLTKLTVPDDFKPRLQRTEINWLPITINNTLYYIYSFDPMRVFKCDERGDCTYFQWPKGEAKVEFDAVQDVLRGGSPFVLYKWPYYIAVGHSQTSTLDDKLLYGANIVVISVHPYFRLVYVSAPIQVKEQLMSSARITRHYTILRPFLFPTGAILRAPDVLDFSAHLSDTRGYVFRLRGLEALMTNVIETDLKAQDTDPSWSNKEPLSFRLSHLLVAQDLAAYHRISRLQYPEIVEHKF